MNITQMVALSKANIPVGVIAFGFNLLFLQEAYVHHATECGAAHQVWKSN